MNGSPNYSSASIRGIKYPLTIVKGNLAVSEDLDLIAQQIRSVVETRFFERVMRADYGVSDRTLDVLDPGPINSEIHSSIQEYVNGLSGLSVEGDWLSEGEDGIYKVFILYEVNGIPQPPLQFSLAN